MRILTDSPGDGRIFGKPGCEWGADERLGVKVWLNTPPQIARLLRYSSLHLGRGSTEEDAEDTWGTFCAEELDRTIDLYDARAPFEPFLLMRLRQCCWRAGDRIRRRHEESLERQTSEGDVYEIVVVDPDADSEESILDRLRLQRCLSAMPSAYQVPVILHHLEGKSTREIAEDLGITIPIVKIRLFRGRRRLRKCLEPT